MINCLLIFDIIRERISMFNETDIESLLQILKITGLDLRSDDPSSLKDIILTLQERVKLFESENENNITEEFGIRVKFMLDMIYELKNNKKNHFLSSKAPQNLITVVKKLKSNSISEQIQISLKELSLSTDKKWWIKGTSLLSNFDNPSNSEASAQYSKLLEIAKKQGMNTDARRAIFATIMNAEDYLDAFDNLLKLKLKGKNDREIINVIIHCCTKVILFFLKIFYFVFIFSYVGT